MGIASPLTGHMKKDVGIGKCSTSYDEDFDYLKNYLTSENILISPTSKSTSDDMKMPQTKQSAEL